MERNLVRQAGFRSETWGLVEMSVLLTDDIIEFDMLSDKFVNFDILSGDWDRHVLDMQWRYFAPDDDVRLDYIEHGDWLITLLIAKCPVSMVYK